MRQILRNFVLSRLEHYTAELIATHRPKVIAVTGSVGKTTTKQAVAHMLRGKYEVLAHSGNYNSEFGLPLSLFELSAPRRTTDLVEWLKIFRAMRKTVKASSYPYEVVVLEMGADSPGDISRFTQYIKPDIGIVTAVAKVHLEEFKTIDAILEEKWQLARASSYVLYNHDDPRLAKKGEKNPEAYGYGLSKADFWIDLEEFDGKGSWHGQMFLGKERVRTTLPVISKQAVYSLLVAAAVAQKMGVSSKDIANAAAKWQQPNGRMHILRGKKGAIIIDDSYNASPFATVAALDSLSQFSGRKLAILGSMNELGEYEAEGHRLVGEHCSDLDLLATIGYAANKHLAPAAIGAGAPSDAVHECNSPYQAGDFMLSNIQPGDVVLVKGSQNGVFAEEAIKPLLEDPDDALYLVRQTKDWLEKKQEQFS